MPDDDPQFLQGQPGRDVGIVIQTRDHDLIPGREGLPDGPAEVEGQSGHVGPKHDLFGSGGVEQIGHGLAGSVDDLVGAAAVEKGAVEVAVGFDQVTADGLNDRAVHLGATRAIHIGDRPTCGRLLEGWELTAYL